MFARLDLSTFLVCCSGDLSENESEEKPSVAICGGSICILTGLKHLIEVIAIEMLIVSMVVSVIAVFRLVDNTLSSSLHC